MLIFNGKDLHGWRVEGSAQWQVQNGAILTARAENGDGWLSTDQVYEDFALHFSFRCSGCETGVLFRSQRSRAAASGLYYSVSGPGVNTAYVLTRDASGKEISRRSLGSPKDQNFGVAKVPLNESGWNDVEISARGNRLIGVFNGFRTEPLEFLVKDEDKAPSYGSIAFYCKEGTRSQLEIKDVTLEDLTERSALPAEVTDAKFREQKLSDLYYSEGIAVGDLNKDGIADIVAGPFYYLGPDFKTAKELYHSETYNPSVHNRGTYTDSFLMYVYDFNGDGWADVVKINFEGAFVYLNPRGEKRHWDEHQVITGVSAETTQFRDIDGDGRPELILCQGKGAAIQYSYATPDWSDATRPWALHLISEQGNWGHHGLGVGDINGDGRADLVQTSGWWEQPAKADSGLWMFHPAPFGESAWTGMIQPFAGGADMYVYDVNGDGLPDVITSLGAHGWGLAWFEQAGSEWR